MNRNDIDHAAFWLARPKKNYIGGNWITSTGDSFTKVNPATTKPTRSIVIGAHTKTNSVWVAL